MSTRQTRTAMALSLGITAMSGVAGAAPTQATPTPPWELRYADGAGNVLRAWTEADGTAAFVWTPTQPATSSSGTYDGGPAAKGPLTEGECDQLWSAVRQLEAASELRADTRSMGTGAFSMTAPGQASTLLISRSAALDAFDALVADLRP